MKCSLKLLKELNIGFTLNLLTSSKKYGFESNVIDIERYHFDLINFTFVNNMNTYTCIK